MPEKSVGAVFILEFEPVKIVSELLSAVGIRPLSPYNDTLMIHLMFLGIPNVHLRIKSF